MLNHRQQHQVLASWAYQAKKLASPFCWAELASIFRAWMTATTKPPKQMEPKLVVIVLMKLELTADEQQPHSSGSYHHVATVPATMTWTEYC